MAFIEPMHRYKPNITNLLIDQMQSLYPYIPNGIDIKVSLSLEVHIFIDI